MLTESRVNRLTSGGADINVAGASRIIPFDMALVAVGMQGRTEGLGLEAAGVDIGSGGYITCDDVMQTSAAGVFAIGDVTGPPLLAHAAMAQGVLAAAAIAGRETQPLIREDIPRAVYCHPQVASMGITEAQTAERGISVNVGRFPYRANGKALRPRRLCGSDQGGQRRGDGGVAWRADGGTGVRGTPGGVINRKDAGGDAAGDRARYPSPPYPLRNADGGIAGSFRRGHTHVDSVYGG